LTQLNEQRLNTVWQQKVYTKLAGLQYKVIYKKGTENGGGDALSRQCSDELQCCAVSHCTPEWLQELVVSYDQDSDTKELLTKLSLHSGQLDPFSLQQGVIRHKGRIWLASSPAMQLKVIRAMHDTAIGGHSGVPATYSKLKSLFYWPGMKAVVREYVQSCAICQQAIQAWHTISLDFIEGLPRSLQSNCILIVVDKFSKYGHFIPLLHPFTASKVAKVFLDNEYKLHGLPVNIVSDRDCVPVCFGFSQLLSTKSCCELPNTQLFSQLL
jgi:hypothetical protein